MKVHEAVAGPLSGPPGIRQVSGVSCRTVRPAGTFAPGQDHRVCAPIGFGRRGRRWDPGDPESCRSKLCRPEASMEPRFSRTADGSAGKFAAAPSRATTGGGGSTRTREPGRGRRRPLMSALPGSSRRPWRPSRQSAGDMRKDTAPIMRMITSRRAAAPEFPTEPNGSVSNHDVKARRDRHATAVTYCASFQPNRLRRVTQLDTSVHHLFTLSRVHALPRDPRFVRSGQPGRQNPYKRGLAE